MASPASVSASASSSSSTSSSSSSPSPASRASSAPPSSPSASSPAALALGALVIGAGAGSAAAAAGPEPMCVLISTTGQRFRVPVRVAERSRLVREMTSEAAAAAIAAKAADKGGEDADAADADAAAVAAGAAAAAGGAADAAAAAAAPEPEIPLEAIPAATLARVLEFMTRLAAEHGAGAAPLPPLARPLRAGPLTASGCPPWAAALVEPLDRAQLFALVRAADMMDVRELLDVACARVAEHELRGKTTAQLREAHGVVGDLAPEEEAALEAETRFCTSDE